MGAGAAVLAVDFAPRFSAAALLDPAGNLLHHTTLDAGSESEGFDSHVEVLARWAELLSMMVERAGFEVPDVKLVVEDVSHVMTKPAQVLRLQGAFRVLMKQQGFPDPVMVMPSVWQNFFGWKKTEGMSSKGFAGFACEVLGYEILNTKGKQTTDVRDAVLVGRWLVESGMC